MSFGTVEYEVNEKYYDIEIANQGSPLLASSAPFS
jgi:hypothetical protein